MLAAEKQHPALAPENAFLGCVPPSSTSACWIRSKFPTGRYTYQVVALPTGVQLYSSWSATPPNPMLLIFIITERMPSTQSTATRSPFCGPVTKCFALIANPRSMPSRSNGIDRKR